jgi:hypothetical protein
MEPLTMTKRPSLFAAKPAAVPPAVEKLERLASPEAAPIATPEDPKTKRPPSRESKRIFSIYLSPEAWRQLNRLAFDLERPKQALGEEAVEMLFEKYRLNRIS